MRRIRRLRKVRTGSARVAIRAALCRADLARLAAVVVGFALAALLMLSAGCAAPERDAVQTRPASPTRLQQPVQKRRSISRMALARASRSSLLFAAPGVRGPSAEVFARAEWPVTFGGMRAGEVVYYRLWWYDRQGLGRYDVDYGHRRFDYYREGVEVR